MIKPTAAFAEKYCANTEKKRPTAPSKTRATDIDTVRLVLPSPMPWSMIMATGAVEPEEENLTAWFNAGVTVVGMGSKLFPKEAIAQGDWKAISDKCRYALDIIANVKK